MNIVDRARSLVVPRWSDVEPHAHSATDTFASSPASQSDFADSLEDHEISPRFPVVLPDNHRPGFYRAQRRGFPEVVGFGRDELEALDDMEAKERRLDLDPFCAAKSAYVET